MKFRIFSLAALMLFASFSTASALRIQSQPITQLKVSQLSYSESFPFEIQGKIWGMAPKGEVTRILYSIEDVSKTKTWEFSEPFARTFEGMEELDLDFKFDFKDVLVDGNCTLTVELQKSTMNGAFAQTIANGSMALKFPPKAVEKKAISTIKGFNAFFDETSAVTQTRFKNMQKEGKFTVQARLLSVTGELIEKKTSAVLPLAQEEEKEISVLLDAPEEPGRYMVKVQVFEGKEAVTGIKEIALIKKGDFAIISELEITPNQYFYVNDVAKILFSGSNSSWGEPLIVELLVTDADGSEVFTKEFPAETDELGHFSGETELTIKAETSQLHVVTKLRKGVKTLGVYEFSTRPLKKLHATEGQSELSFAIEDASQEFTFSTFRAKMGIIIGIGILILLIFGFIFFIRHMHHLKLFILLLAFFVAGVDAATTSEYPTDGWIINPGSSDNFQTLKFKGNIDISSLDAFITGQSIVVAVHFKDVLDVTYPFETLFQTSQTFVITDPAKVNDYEFTVDAPAALVDGEYPVELVFAAGPGVTGSISPLEIPLNLSIFADSTPPTLEFNYFDNEVELTLGDFTNDPVELGVECIDTTGCLLASADIFEVRGNFCSGESFCEAATDEFVLCDQVGNCTGPTQVEINHYDPVAPEIGSLDLENVAGEVSATTKLKALESYVFSLFDLADPATTTEVVAIDDSACDSGDSPFVEVGENCVEREIMCAETLPNYFRGIEDYDSPGTCLDECPAGTIRSEWGTCIDMDGNCSYTSFPFCFNWQLADESCSGTFPLCFNWELECEESTTWTPSTGTVCTGINFTQTGTECGENRIVAGTKTCADCTASTEDYCSLADTADGGSDGECARGYTGSCSFPCNDGTWGMGINNCTTATGASCTASTVSNCSRSATVDGGVSGDCDSGYTGTCSYTCDDGTWDLNNNNCTAATGASCTASTVSNCSRAPTADGGTSGSCNIGYTGSCSYTCNNGTWGIPASNSCTAACTPTNGEWNDWEPWECDTGGNPQAWLNNMLTAQLIAYTGSFDRGRTRTCNNPCGGTTCSGPTLEEENCPTGEVCSNGNCAPPSCSFTTQYQNTSTNTQSNPVVYCQTREYTTTSGCTSSTWGNINQGVACGTRYDSGSGLTIPEACDTGACLDDDIPIPCISDNPCKETAYVLQGDGCGTAVYTQNRSAGYDTGLCSECDGNGNEVAASDDNACGTISCGDWWHKTGTAGWAWQTEYCYDSPDMTSNRCASLGVCKSANSADCGSGNGTAAVTCGLCKQMTAGKCTGTINGQCDIASDGTWCADGKWCDNGDCYENCDGNTLNGCIRLSRLSGESNGTCDTGYTNGSCSYLCTNGNWSGSNTCAQPGCTPNCTGKECGSDGCGGVCTPNNCATNYPCISGQCECVTDSDCPAPGAGLCYTCMVGGECDACFAGPEEVMTPGGAVAIQDIQVGDLVVSYDEAFNEFTTSVVGEIIIHDGGHENINNYSKANLLEVIVAVGDTDTRTEVTDNHLYFSPDENIYKPIGTFEIGESVLSFDGRGVIKSKTVLIDGTSSAIEQQTVVYNIHMSSGPANYLVDGIVVHNNKGDEIDCY